MSNEMNHGGRRPGAGRPTSTLGLTEMVTVRVTPEAKAIIDGKKNKSEFIDRIIKENAN